MIFINGLLKNIDINNIENNEPEIIFNWYKAIDKIYFSNSDYHITLSKSDKILINKFEDCLEKLTVLNFKNNIIIENF